MKKCLFLIVLGVVILASGCISQKTTGTFNLEEISKHNVEDDCWLLIHGKVYDVTQYLSEHPGGVRNITINCGTDATDEFELKPTGRTHSENARAMLERYYIGDLVS